MFKWYVVYEGSIILEYNTRSGPKEMIEWAEALFPGSKITLEPDAIMLDRWNNRHHAAIV